jgi:hypothetical protein
MRLRGLPRTELSVGRQTAALVLKQTPEHRKTVAKSSAQNKRTRAAKSSGKSPSPAEPFLLSPRGYRAWRDRLKGEGRTPTIAFREAATAIFRVVEWSILTGAVGALGLWVDSHFLLWAAVFLMAVLTIYILSFIYPLRQAEGFERPINWLLMAFLALALVAVASNFTRMVVLYGWQQLQQLPPPKDPSNSESPIDPSPS